MATDKDFVVKNGLQVGTTANVSGNVNACSALTVAGLTTLSSNVNVDSGTLFVDTSANRVGVNTASPDVALTVQGSANVSVNLKVGGNLIIAGNTETVGTTISTGNNIPNDNTYFLGNTTNRWSIFAKSFTSDGVAAISNTLASGNVTVTGFANVSSTLAVTGAATLSSTLSVTGNTVISGTANVTGAVALANTLGATGAVTFANTLTVTGLANLNSGINTTFVNASANLTVGANVLVDTAKLFIGNSTVNTTHNVTTVQISNSTSTANLSAIDLKIGTTTVNSTAVGVGANVILSTSEVSVGNSTVNTKISASEVLGYSNAYFNVISSNGNILVGNSTVNVTVNSSQFNVGSNVNLTPSRFNVGNSTVNTFITSTAIETDGTLTVAGNTVLSGTANVTGAAVFSNNVTIAGNLTVSGTTTYVNTTTLNISDNIITLNADLAATNAPTESAGIEINRGSSANVILQWNETTDAWELTNDGSTYSNIATVAYSSNATNISSGTLNTARLPSQVNVSTQIYVGANVSLNATVIAVGNSTVYSNISGGTISVTGLATTGNLNTTTVNATSINANTTGIHTGNVSATQVNASANVITPTLYGNVVATYVSASANVTVGANVIANLTTVAVGNSTVYSNVAAGTINITGLATTGNLNTTTANATTSIYVGANVLANVTTVAVGNSTVYSNIAAGTITTTGLVTTGNINSTVANVTTLNVTGLATTGNLNTTTANVTTLNATTSIAGAANLALTGALHTLSGNVNVDAGVFFVDGTNNRVGINNSAPDASLTVTGTANVSGAVRIGGVTTAAANVALANNFLTEPTLKAYKEYTESGGTVTTAYTANLALSNIFTLTGTNGSNCVFTFGSPPASGNAQMFTIVFKQPATGSANVTWPASVKWSYGDTPIVSATVNARDVFTFLTFDGGTTYLGALSMANVAS